MKTGFRKAVTIFKYLAILFSIAYWPYVIVDDWRLIGQNWAEHLTIWALWFFVYLFSFSLYYWIAASIIIFILYLLRTKKATSE